MNQERGDRGAPPGTLTTVQNARILNGGLQKRPGTSAITGATFNVSSAQALSDTSEDSRPVEHPAFIGRIGSQKIAATSAGVAFTKTSGQWLVAGGVSSAQPARKRLGISPSLPTRPVGPHVAGCAVSSTGYICTAAGYGAELRVTVESPDGAPVYERDVVIGAANIIVRVVNVGSVFLVCYQASASTTITVRTLTIVNGGIVDGGTASAATLNNAASCWDTSTFDGTNWFLVWQSGATTVTVARMAGTSAAGSATFASTDNLTYLSIWADPPTATGRVFVGIVDDPTGTPSAQFRVFTAGPVASLGPTTISTVFTPIAPPLFGPLYTRSPGIGDAFCVFSVDMGSPSGTEVVGTITARIVGGSVESNQLRCFNVLPVSKPDAQHRVWAITYAPGTNYQTAQIALLRFADADAVAAVGGPGPLVDLASPVMETMGSAYHPFAQASRAFHAVAVTSEDAGGSAFFALPVVLTSRTNASGATEPTTRVDVYEYTRWNQEPHRQCVPTGLSAVVSGQPTELYGIQTQISGSPFVTGGVELGFLQGPVILSATTTPSGSGLAAGSYVYQAVSQWVDDEGRRHLSAPSAPLTVTLAVPSSVALNIAGGYCGQRISPERDVEVASPLTLVYRTQNAGTEAQQVPIATTEPGATWSGFIQATDTVADSIIDDNEFIYTAGGVLPNVLGPSCRYIAVSEERLWCGGLWDSNLIECSKIRVPGEPYNFTGHPSHQVVIPGEVSGLAYMDGQVVVFTEDAIYLVGGDGPNDQGAGGFAPPRALVRGIGCPRVQSASILETELGIIFRSAMGFYLIPRGFGSPQFIGGPVHDEDEVVLSAATTTTENYRLARFLVCASGETKSDTVLTLDLTNMQWVRDEYQVNGSITGQGFSEIGEWPDGLALFSYGLQRTDNLSVIWAEDEDLTGDAAAASAGASTYISARAQTAWIQPWGPLGVGRVTRVQLACEPLGASQSVTISVETDANTIQSNAFSVTSAESAAYREIQIKEPTCSAFRVTVEDSAGSDGSVAGVRLIGIGCELQPHGGMRAVKDDERA
jgi:hypothetical protein